MCEKKKIEQNLPDLDPLIVLPHEYFHLYLNHVLFLSIMVIQVLHFLMHQVLEILLMVYVDHVDIIQFVDPILFERIHLLHVVYYFHTIYT